MLVFVQPAKAARWRFSGGWQTRLDNAQPWAGTLTQRHGRLIGTKPQGVESLWPRPSSGAGGLWNDGPELGAAVTGAPIPQRSGFCIVPFDRTVRQSSIEAARWRTSAAVWRRRRRWIGERLISAARRCRAPNRRLERAPRQAYAHDFLTDDRRRNCRTLFVPVGALPSLPDYQRDRSAYA
jgi:hypothetical protein